MKLRANNLSYARAEPKRIGKRSPKVTPMGPRGGKRIDNDKKTTKRWRNGETHNSKRWPETMSLPLELKWEQQVQVKTKNKNKQAQEGFKWDPVTAVIWHVLHSLSAKRRKRTTKQPKQQDESTGAVGCPLMPFFRKGSMLGSESWSTLMKSQRRRRRTANYLHGPGWNNEVKRVADLDAK